MFQYFVSLLPALDKSTDQNTDRNDQQDLLYRLVEWARGPACNVFEIDEIVGDRVISKAVLALSVGMVDHAARIAIEYCHKRLVMLLYRTLDIPKVKHR